MNLRHVFLAALVGALLFGAAMASSAFAVGSFTTVVSGLDNPRDLDFSPNGNLYVAEAGSGGPDCVSGDEGAFCPGLTSGLSVVDITAGTSHRVVSGLASVSDVGGFAAMGLDGISFQGNGTLFGIMALSSDAVPEGVFSADLTEALKAQLGRLLKFNPSGRVKTVADVGHFDFEWTADRPDLVPGQFPDANPYAVFAAPGVRWVVDAASNTIGRALPNGEVTVDVFIPNPPVSDAVPTCIDRGPDGAFYIGELTGAGNQPGSARIWRYAPGEATPLTQWATGLTAVTGCGFGADGQFYATEFSTLGFENGPPGTGAVVRVAPHSTSPTTVVDGLSFPGGFAAGADGSIYVSNWSIAPSVTGLGAVVQITP